MVYFKSILDPLWSAGDMAALRSRFPWVILVLSPFERFYEFDPALDELSAGTSQLIIWRPDRPSLEESTRLRVSSLASPAGRSESAINYSGIGAAGHGVRQLLTALYVQRGTLITQGVRHSVSQSMGSLSLPRHIAGVLSSRAAKVMTQTEMTAAEAENLALRWGGLLCQREESSSLNLYDGEGQVLAWAAKYLEGRDGMPLGLLQSMPETFLTTRFRNEVKSLDTAIERIQRIMGALQKGEISFVPAMTQISQLFNGDEARLLRWKVIAEDLPGFLGWLAGFERSYSYLSVSFPTSNEELERLRADLLAACSEPHRFLDAREREMFDSKFESFKSSYVDLYVSAHEDTMQIVSGHEHMNARQDTVALRNLEQLSELSPAGRKCLSQIRTIARFIKASQCNLPVREILTSQPRCFCNFHPSANRLLVRSVDRMNRILRGAMDEYRSALRRSGKVIIQELGHLDIEDTSSRPIAALLSRGPMMALEQPALEVLRTILHKHPEILPSSETRPPVPGLGQYNH